MNRARVTAGCVVVAAAVAVLGACDTVPEDAGVSTTTAAFADAGFVENAVVHGSAGGHGIEHAYATFNATTRTSFERGVDLASVDVVISAYPPAACASHGAFVPGNVTLSISLQRQAADDATTDNRPGTWSVGGAGVVTSIGETMSGYATVEHVDAQCAAPDWHPVSGFVTIASMTPELVKGSFDLRFLNGEPMWGTFDAKACDDGVPVVIACP